MRSPAIVAATLVLATCLPAAVGAQAATGSTTVSATFGSRTTLRVSTHVLEFRVTDPSQPATASVEFVAAARTGVESEVRLVVEPSRAVQGPGGAADVEATLAVEGGTPGVQPGLVPVAMPATAARWTGGGRREGRIAFSLRAAARGTYTVPVSFAITVP